MPAVTYPHIEIRPDGVPYVAGTETKVVEIILWRLAHCWDADEIHRQHPDLGLAQIHSALAYYYNHQEELDGDIRQRLRREQELLDRLRDSPLQRRLRDAKRAAAGLRP